MRDETQRWTGRITVSDSSVLAELLEITRVLYRERDVERLLALVLESCLKVTCADAGTIYVVESLANGERVLRAHAARNASREIHFQTFVVPMDTSSIAGAAAVSRMPLRHADVYELHAGLPYKFDRNFDEHTGYRTRSMMTLPLLAATHEVVGAVQLINRKRHVEVKLQPGNVEHEVIPFDARDEEVSLALAAQGGVALENALLYDEIRHIFDGFVRASVRAIEARDPTTSGHSQRVSMLSLGLARAVSASPRSPFRTQRFSDKELRELEYASLLHDFGKIGVREDVLVKAKKLHPGELTLIEQRFAFASKSLEAAYLHQELALVDQGGSAHERTLLREECARKRGELMRYWEVVRGANEPTVLPDGDFSTIATIGEQTYEDLRGLQLPLLTANEVVALQIRRGSLTETEVDQIRSHVSHTIDFLHQIPWGRTYARIPEIAGAHHERLNGTGYPLGLVEDAIPTRAKIMAIADIFDALTARDRPYKRALPIGKALDILKQEADARHIDPNLLELFVQARVWEPVFDGQ